MSPLGLRERKKKTAAKPFQIESTLEKKINRIYRTKVAHFVLSTR